MSNQLAARGIQTLKIRDKDKGEFVTLGYFLIPSIKRDARILSLEFQFAFPDYPLASCYDLARHEQA